MSVSYDENEKKKQYKIKSVTAAIQIGQTKSGTGTTNLYTFRSIFWETCLSRVKLQSEKTKVISVFRSQEMTTHHIILSTEPEKTSTS